jgi:hypothetical protein
VLAAIHQDARLRGWCGILPTVLAEGKLGNRPYLVEEMLPGVPANGIVCDGAPETALLSSAAAAIGELHRRTARPAEVVSAMFERWIEAPACVVRGTADGGGAIDRLVAQLRETLEGRTLSLSWVHGDFVPSNILVSADGEAVLGIVDWELAAANDVSSIDLVSLLVSTRAERQRQAVGRVVRELINGAHWTESEEAVLHSADPPCEVDTRTLVLLWWLRHVSSNLSKSTRYTRRGLWARWNIDTVLEAVERP